MANLEILTGMAGETHQLQGERLPSVAIAGPDKRLYFRIKRLIDIVLSLILLILLSPLFLLVAICIRLDSPGPVLFAQTRVGQNHRREGGNHHPPLPPGQPERRLGGHQQQQDVGARLFTLYKFRTMYHNCDQSLHKEFIKIFAQHQHRSSGLSGDSVPFKLIHDSRITKVGRFLRKTSLDELPQLFNVLKGEMSLVGPRPVPVYEVAEYSAWHRRRLEATPGITGLWQVRARGRGDIDEMARLDIEYIENQCLRLDMKILLQTVPAVLSGRGAE